MLILIIGQPSFTVFIVQLKGVTIHARKYITIIFVS